MKSQKNLTNPNCENDQSAVAGELREFKALFVDQANELDALKRAMDEHAIFAMTNVKGEIEYVNEKFCEVSGYSREELVGENHRILKSGQHDLEFYREMWRVISSGKVWQGLICNKKKSGDIYWVDCTFVPVLGAEGKPTAYMGIRRDVTDLVEKEREIAEINATLELRVAERTRELAQANECLVDALARLQVAKDRLVQNEKLAALGEMVAGVAHEMNTPIGNGVLVASSLVKKVECFKKLVGSGMRRSVLDKFIADTDEAAMVMWSNLDAAARLVAKFKLASQDHGSEIRKEFNVKDVIESVIATFAAKLAESAVFVDFSEVGENLILEGYPSALLQALAQLLSNSMTHAYPSGGGMVAIQAMRVGDSIQISVEDFGVGIAPENMGKIFLPFFTTSRSHGGTGLGLHIAHSSIVGVLGGQIDVLSHLGQGVKFVILLPLKAP